jgi:aminopeptidase N
MSKDVRRLFAGFHPTNYTLTLDVDRDTRRIAGTVVVTGQKVGRPSERLTFHQKGLKVKSASITRHDKRGDQQFAVTRINLQQSYEEVRLHTQEQLHAGQYEVTMTFEASIQDGMHGVYVCNYELNGKKQQLVATQFESTHARECFPCIDEPEAKASFDLTLLTPKGEPVLSNTPAKEQSEQEGKQKTSFETTPKMSTYLLAFVYGDMHCKEAKTKDDVTVRVWATKAQPIEALDFPLEVATRGIEFYNEYYGVPYPLAKCDHVALPDFSAGAMENWGLITYREVALLADPATTSQSSREYISMVIMHELSHQWFGDLVTMRWWDDLWLNESFANVMEFIGPNALFPEWHVMYNFAANDGLSALRRDAIAGVQPVKMPVHHPDEIDTLFDPSIVYAKGSRIIDMMRHYIGEDVFRKGLKTYFDKNAYANTTGDDLWTALDSASGKGVASFMGPWLLRPGFPVLSVTQQGKQLTLAQSHFCLDPGKADSTRHWPVPTFASSDAVPVLLDKPEASLQLPSDEYVRVNQGAVGHYIVRYTEPAHAAAIAEQAGSKQLDIPERLMLLSDSSLLARAGMQSFGNTLELLNHYTNEDSEPVWDIMALTLADARRFIDTDERLEEQIKDFIRKLVPTQYERLGWQERAGESNQDTKLRATILGLGVYAKHEAITNEALKLFEAYKTDPGAVASELRSIVMSAAVRYGADGAFDYLLELEEKTQNADLKQDLMAALTSTRSTEEGGRLLARIKDQTKVRQQDITHWLVSLLRNRYIQAQAWDWLRTEWDWLEKLFAGDKSYDYFPRYAALAFNTRERLQEYRDFFGPKAAQPVLTRNVNMGIEELETRVAWIERDLAGVQQFFAKHRR